MPTISTTDNPITVLEDLGDLRRAFDLGKTIDCLGASRIIEAAERLINELLDGGN